MKSEITEICIKLGDKEIKLTMEEAKHLHENLSKIFPAGTRTEYVPYYPWWQVYPEPETEPFNPVWIAPMPVTCQGLSGSSTRTQYLLQ